MDMETEDFKFDLIDEGDSEMLDDDLSQELKEIEEKGEKDTVKLPSTEKDTFVQEPCDNKDSKFENDEFWQDSFRKGLENIDFRRLNRSLHIDRETDPAIVGREIAYRLHERKYYLFGHIVRVLGQYIVSEIFAEAKYLVNNGGLRTEKGDRLRSPGGTFLYLMKHRGFATPSQIKAIFKEDKQFNKQGKKKFKKRNMEKEETDIEKVKKEDATNVKSEENANLDHEVPTIHKEDDLVKENNDVIIKNENICDVKNVLVTATSNDLPDECGDCEEGEIECEEGEIF